MKFRRIIGLLKNPKSVFTIMAARGLLNRISDEKYLKILFWLRTGKRLNLEDPHTFNEKMQWLKIHDRKPIYTELVDKYCVRRHIQDWLGNEKLIPIIGGPWSDFDEIEFEKLPRQFVIKCTHDSGGLVICRDKNSFDKESARRKIGKSLNSNFYWQGREWPYKNVKPRIIAEKYMEDENGTSGLTDYKFFCFSGEPKFIYVSQGLENHETASISFFDLEGNPMPFRRKDYRPIEEPLSLPENFQEMLDIARKLASKVNNPFVRIDLYSIRGKVLFSEITFSPCSGIIPFEPEEWDARLGKELILHGK